MSCINASETVSPIVNRIRHIYDSSIEDSSFDSVSRPSLSFTSSVSNTLLRYSTSHNEATSGDKPIKREINRRTPRKRAQDHKLRRFHKSSIEPLNLETGLDNIQANKLALLNSYRRIASYDSRMSIDSRVDSGNSKLVSPLLSTRSANEVQKTIKLKKATSVSYTLERSEHDNTRPLSAKEDSKCGYEVQALNGGATLHRQKSSIPSSIKESSYGSSLDCASASFVNAKPKRSSTLPDVCSTLQGYTESDYEGYASLKTPNVQVLNRTVTPDPEVTKVKIKRSPSLLQIIQDETDSLSFARDVGSGVFRLFYHTQGNYPTGKRWKEASLIPERFVVNKQPFVVGTNASASLLFIKTRYPHITSNHCHFVFEPVETQEGNENGIIGYKVEVIKVNNSGITFVNDVPLRTRMTLKNGDMVGFGPKKYAVWFRIVFRTLEECLVLDKQFSCLRLHPSKGILSGIKTLNRVDLVSLEKELSSSSNADVVEAVKRENKLGALNSKVQVMVFELCTSYRALDITPINQNVLNGHSPCIKRPPLMLNEENAASKAHLVKRESGSVTNGSLNTPTEQNGYFSSQYFDFNSTTSPSERDVGPILLLNAYTSSEGTETHGNSTETAANTDANCTSNPQGTPFDLSKAFMRYENAKTTADPEKLALLKSLNKNSFPLVHVVDTARSSITDKATPRGSRVAVNKLLYLGMLNTFYKCTIKELLPEIDDLLRTRDTSSGTISEYNVLLKRNSAPLSNSLHGHSWVFQLDFFDNDDPLYRRAMCKSDVLAHNQDVSLDDLLLRFNRARVLFLQSKKS